ncbi:MAG: transposase, partial [Truepera sp.]|nr:transposase [Truepera sp.]
VKGRKRQLAVNVEGSPLAIQIHEASVQDRDSAPPLILELLAKSPTVKKLFADGAYAGPKLARRLKKFRTRRTARDRGQTQGRDPKSPSLGLYRAISSLGSRKDLCLAGSLSASSQPEESVFGLRDPSESENPPFELLRVR